MKTKEILDEETKKETRKKVFEIVETILTIGLNHLYKWLKSLIIK